MKQKWNNFKNVSSGVWAIRAILLLCIIGLIVIKIFQYLAIPTVGAVNVNLRQSPSPDGRVIKVLPNDTKISVIKKDNNTNWWKVVANGQTGWVASWLLNQKHYNAKNSTRLPEATIVLDPGHGGNDSGTLTHLGTNKADMEKTYTLPLALQVRDLLQKQHAQIIMTRTTDSSVTLGQRTRLSNRVKANLFISFHYNSSSTVNYGTGYGIYKYYETSSGFANLLDTNFSNLPLTDRGIGFGNFYVLRNNQRPALLIEMGFMDNTKDFKYIKNQQYTNTVAHDVDNAMKQYFK